MSQLDFLYSPERAFMSDIRSIVNISEYSNTTHVFLPTPRVHIDWQRQHVVVSIAFVNFCFALTCFMVKYASVFWFTNKALTLVFALQLLAMVTNSIFSFNCFSILYCVCHNLKKYPNVHISMVCPMDLVLYLFGSLILLVSTTFVFEYGSHYYDDKFKIIERHHNPESYVKQTVVTNTGCQGYVPHVCAMTTLIVFAVCKSPLLYDLVALMRLTDDPLLLCGVICEVFYMVIWVGLWFGLTVKQQWQFRILDYIPLRQPPRRGSRASRGSQETISVRSGPASHGDNVANFIRNKRLAIGRENATQRYSDPFPIGYGNNDNPSVSDMGTEDSDIGNNVQIVLDEEGNPMPDTSGHLHRPRYRKFSGQRVKFDARHTGTGDHERQTSSLPRHVTYGHEHPDSNHVNVKADIHSITPPPNIQHEDSSQDTARRKVLNPSGTSSARNYCSSSNNLAGSSEDPAPLPNPAEPLPTLMSSFRDKVRESSINASNFKEREKNMLGHYSYVDNSVPQANPMQEAELNDAEKRRCIAISDEDLGDGGCCQLGLPSPGDSAVRSTETPQDVICGIDASRLPSSNHRLEHSNTSAFRKKQHNVPIISRDNGVSNEPTDTHLTSLPEHSQLSRIRSNSSGRKEDYHKEMVGGKMDHHLGLQTRPVQVVVGKKAEIGRRDSANYSLTSSQDTSSNESDHGHGLCSQV